MGLLLRLQFNSILLFNEVSNIGHWEVYKCFAGKIYEQMVALIQSRSLEL